MRKIDSGYDGLLKANYELCASTLTELKTLAKSWYGDIDFSEFDRRNVREEFEDDFIEMKKSGIMSNYFFAYKENDKYYLLDGFNRLFTDYGEFNIDTPVYVKVITDNLEDHELMHIMFRLNMWKLQFKRGGFSNKFKINDFLDRGFRLFLNKKFDIDFYFKENYNDRIREKNDFNLIYKYFINEREITDDFTHNISGVSVIFKNERIIEDIKHMIKCNDFLNLPFNHYDTFLSGFVMFLSWRRVNGDSKEYKFETYLEKLKEDTKFFNKLQKMSWTDSTRKNVYKWFIKTYKKEND